jgi:hypothetical protein
MLVDGPDVPENGRGVPVKDARASQIHQVKLSETTSMTADIFEHNP